MSDKYKEMKVCSSEHGERGDCTVIATAIACDIPYAEAHALMKAAGRPDRDGFKFGLRGIPALEKAGYKVEDMRDEKGLTPRQKPKKVRGYDRWTNDWYERSVESAYTPKTIGKLLKEGRYIAFVRGHVLAVVDGVVHDWTKGTKKRIYKIVKVTKA